MTSILTVEHGIQDAILGTVRKSQEVVIEALQAWTDAVQPVIPSFPAVSLPYVGKLPTPQALVADAYDFAGQLLATQRGFAENLIQATAPLAGGAA